jgi:hypothetical protein
MLFHEEIIFGQAKRQDLADQAIRIARDLLWRKPPDISAREVSELSAG